MAQNKVQFQKGVSLPQFLSIYGTEEQCFDALFAWRWPSGFRCPECGCTKSCRLTARKLQQCNKCHHQASITAGTIFQSTKLPLRIWFLGIYFVTQDKKGISSLELKRCLGISYKAAWRMKHKLSQVMLERDEAKPLLALLRLMMRTWVVNVAGASADVVQRIKRPLWRRFKQRNKDSQ